jgi:hypothetical protein
MWFQVLTAVAMKSCVFWDVTQYNLVELYDVSRNMLPSLSTLKMEEVGFLETLVPHYTADSSVSACTL